MLKVLILCAAYLLYAASILTILITTLNGWM